MQPIDHLGKGAVHGRERLVREPFGNFEYEVAGEQIEKLRITAVAVGIFLDRSSKAEPIRAVVQLSPQTIVAAQAREEVRKDDPVALFERNTPRVSRHSKTQRVDSACHLVPQNERSWLARHEGLHLTT